MWNLYVTAVMIFYSPSHKNKPSENYGLNFISSQAGQNKDFNIIIYKGTNSEETMEFANMETRVADSTSNATESVLTAFANKIASSQME